MQSQRRSRTLPLYIPFFSRRTMSILGSRKSPCMVAWILIPRMGWTVRFGIVAGLKSWLKPWAGTNLKRMAFLVCYVKNCVEKPFGWKYCIMTGHHLRFNKLKLILWYRVITEKDDTQLHTLSNFWAQMWIVCDVVAYKCKPYFRWGTIKCVCSMKLWWNTPRFRVTWHTCS